MMTSRLLLGCPPPPPTLPDGESIVSLYLYSNTNILSSGLWAHSAVQGNTSCTSVKVLTDKTQILERELWKNNHVFNVSNGGRKYKI